MSLFENLKTYSHSIIHPTYQTLNLIEISSQDLVSNFNYFQNLHPEAKICPVLKSNAYGHGLKLVAKFIDQKINSAFICVDSLYEAFELEKEKIHTPILILGYTFPQNFKIEKRLNFSFPVYDEETLVFLNKYQPQAGIHLKIDTGMNRLGIRSNEVTHFIKLLKKYPRTKIDGIYSHLGQADDPCYNNYTQKQIDAFKNIIKLFESNGFIFKWKHISATAGATFINDPEFNLIRLGLGFYGLSPFPSSSKPGKNLIKNLKPALKLTSHLVQIAPLVAGESVSYGGDFKARKKMKIGILPLGYYDGLDRRFSNKGIVLLDGTQCPIIGKICMNLSIIDLSKAINPEVGQEVVVYSPNPTAPNSIVSCADLIDSIPYELLVNLSETTRRILV